MMVMSLVISLVSMVIMGGLLGLGIYTWILVIKALRIYIKKNS